MALHRIVRILETASQIDLMVCKIVLAVVFFMLQPKVFVIFKATTFHHGKGIVSERITLRWLRLSVGRFVPV